MPKFTFKKEPPETGLRAVGNSYPSTVVKLGGKEVGRIQAPNWATKDRKWGVGLIVAEASSENCPWRWAFFKPRFDDEPSARQWLLDNQAMLAERYQIVCPDDFR